MLQNEILFKSNSFFSDLPLDIINLGIKSIIHLLEDPRKAGGSAPDLNKLHKFFKFNEAPSAPKKLFRSISITFLPIKFE